jgi:hypothetical protein
VAATDEDLVLVVGVVLVVGFQAPVAVVDAGKAVD